MRRLFYTCVLNGITYRIWNADAARAASKSVHDQSDYKEVAEAGGAAEKWVLNETESGCEAAEVAAQPPSCVSGRCRKSKQENAKLCVTKALPNRGSNSGLGTLCVA